MIGTSKNDSPIDLLIINADPNAAEIYISTLRNANLAVHSTSANDLPELSEHLSEGGIDLILYSATPGGMDFQTTVDLCLRDSPDIPLIIVYQGIEPESLVSAMQKGARDVVAEEDLEHLQLVAQREFADLETRRELANVRKKLQDAEARCTSLIESSQDAIAYIHEGMHMHANPVYLKMFGYVDLEELEGLPLLDMVSSSDHQKLKPFLRTLEIDASELKVKCQGSDSSTFDATLEFSPATYDGEPCTQIIIRNQPQSRELEEKIELLSHRDSHTGLANRQYFMESLDQRIKEMDEDSSPCSLFYLVIDDYPKIRTGLGILTSDELLREISRVIESCIGEGDLLSRFGDHTFTILSSGGNSMEAESMAERLRQSIESHSYLNAGDSASPTCSIGLTLFDHQMTSQEFLNHAYQACESIRSTGGNDYSLYDASEMAPSYGDDTTGNEAKIIELIEHALNNNRFRLVYQPIVSLQGDSRENYAVLMRLLDNNDEEIMPNFFINSAEQSGLMAKVDRWVIKTSIEEIARQRKQGRKVNFFISLSSAALEDDGLLLWICDCLREHQAKGAWLTFQVRDKDLRNHIQSAKRLIAGLKKIKCQLAIDQFGTNPKAESLLKHLPVDFVKFDTELVDDLASKQEKQEQLSELNRLALNHDTKTIAMGVEDANSLAVLWTVGVNYIQGYFLQEPSENIAYEFGSA
jgi:diguanylate cyclase (GGDEF)-like protein/PAS domain S-box-containing protein